MNGTAGSKFCRKDFWERESPKFAAPHHRLQKAVRMISRIAGSRECSLLDVGCGPATLAKLLPPNIRYYGIDIAIQDPGPNLLENDILESPIRFRDQQFDIVIAHGLFEYLADAQDVKLCEIARLMAPGGTFIVSYTNFAHRKPERYHAFSNVQSVEHFRVSLEREFVVKRVVPTSYNWSHGQPDRRVVKFANKYVNLCIPIIGPTLAVEYFFICSRSLTAS